MYIYMVYFSFLSCWEVSLPETLLAALSEDSPTREAEQQGWMDLQTRGIGRIGFGPQDGPSRERISYGWLFLSDHWDGS